MQKVIDQYVFEQHTQEIADKGFKVTHTGPMDGYVEVCITLYSERNAEYLYKIFGSEIVKVVEGQQAVLLTTGAPPPDASVAGIIMYLPCLFWFGTLMMLYASYITKNIIPSLADGRKLNRYYE